MLETLAKGPAFPYYCVGLKFELNWLRDTTRLKTNRFEAGEAGLEFTASERPTRIEDGIDPHTTQKNLERP